MEHRFQINLRGLIDLLSNHLYSTPEVFVRELLQNGVDAIRARSYLDPRHQGEIVVEVHERAGKPPTLSFSDNGIGLNEEEIHKFLATIGESSKRPGHWDRPVDFNMGTVDPGYRRISRILNGVDLGISFVF